MKKIYLSGKIGIDQGLFALVDDVDFEYLNQWKWKAKPNGSNNNIYAVRNSLFNGRNVTIRMHREVLGLAPSDLRDTDHINHNPLDNRRCNLRAVTRRLNILNARRHLIEYRCLGCGHGISERVTLAVKSKVYCSPSCEAKFKVSPRSPVFFAICAFCERRFVAKHRTRQFCSDNCRVKAKYRRTHGLRRVKSEIERIKDALPNGSFTSDLIAVSSGVHPSNVRRIFPALIASRVVRLVRDGRPKLYEKI